MRETKHEIKVEAAMVVANCLKNSPEIPEMKADGLEYDDVDAVRPVPVELRRGGGGAGAACAGGGGADVGAPGAPLAGPGLPSAPP